MKRGPSPSPSSLPSRRDRFVSSKLAPSRLEWSPGEPALLCGSRMEALIRAPQDVIGHVAHFVHLVHFIPETHSPVEAVLAEVDFPCGGQEGVRGVISALPHTSSETGAKLFAVISPGFSGSFQGFSHDPPSPSSAWEMQEGTEPGTQ